MLLGDSDAMQVIHRTIHQLRRPHLSFNYGGNRSVTGIDEVNPLPPVVEVLLAEQAQIRRTLVANQGNITKTARQLGLSRQALYRRLEKYGI